MIKISDSELEIMSIIWKKDEITSGEIIQNLGQKSWKDNTIRTFIKRLLNKKAIIIYSQSGKNYIYKPNINKQEYFAKVTDEYIKKAKMLMDED